MPLGGLQLLQGFPQLQLSRSRSRSDLKRTSRLWLQLSPAGFRHAFLCTFCTKHTGNMSRVRHMCCACAAHVPHTDCQAALCFSRKLTKAGKSGCLWGELTKFNQHEHAQHVKALRRPDWRWESDLERLERES